MELAPNSLAFIALCNEYCCAVENCRESQPADFIASMLRLLPRIYIVASDLKPAPLMEDTDPYIESYLDEDYYESLRREIENLLGPDDVYLEVFEEDMKYSDTPIGMSVAEGVCDIFQVLYNFISMSGMRPKILSIWLYMPSERISRLIGASAFAISCVRSTTSVTPQAMMRRQMTIRRPDTRSRYFT